MTAKEALQRAKESLHLQWAGDHQVAPVTDVIEKLADALSSPEEVLHLVQVLWLPQRSDVRDRPSARDVLARIVEAAPTLAQGETGLSWARVVAWAALRVGVEKESRIAAMVSLLRSGAEWSDEEARYQSLLKELCLAACKASEASLVETSSPYIPFDEWPTKYDDHAEEAKAYAEIINGYGENPQPQPPQNLPFILHPGHIKALLIKLTDKVAFNTIDLRQDYNALHEAITHIEQRLLQPPAVSDSAKLLWWGQSLYSSSLHESYRDLNDAMRLFWMAEDMAAIGRGWPSEARIAYFSETLRRIVPELDVKVPVREHAKRLIEGVQAGLQCGDEVEVTSIPEGLGNAVEKEPTGLPITFLVEGARRKTDSQELLKGLKEKVDLDLDREISGRQWARWVCRERLLLRFLHDEWAK